MSQYTEARQRMADPPGDTPSMRHRCAAEGCPMAGTISAGGESSSWCAYHYACHPNDIASITSVLNQHHDLRDIVNAGRRLLVSKDADPSTFAAEWKRMRELLRFAGYEQPTLRPAACETITGWLYSCESMLYGLVTQAMGARRKDA